MDKDLDQAKGKIKQAVGNVTGDKDLKNEGKVDEATGNVKEFFEDAKEKVEHIVDQLKDRVTKH